MQFQKEDLSKVAFCSQLMIYLFGLAVDPYGLINLCWVVYFTIVLIQLDYNGGSRPVIYFRKQ